MKNIRVRLFYYGIVVGVLALGWWVIDLQNQFFREPVPAEKLRAFTKASPCQAQAVREQLNQHAKIVLKKDLLSIKNHCYRLDKIAKTQATSAATDGEILESQRAILN
jgi:hypothetical protein